MNRQSPGDALPQLLVSTDVIHLVGNLCNKIYPCHSRLKLFWAPYFVQLNELLVWPPNSVIHSISCRLLFPFSPLDGWMILRAKVNFKQNRKGLISCNWLPPTLGSLASETYKNIILFLIEGASGAVWGKRKILNNIIWDANPLSGFQGNHQDRSCVSCDPVILGSPLRKTCKFPFPSLGGGRIPKYKYLRFCK